MSPDERELRLLMVKVEIRQQRLPALGCMAGVTGDRQFAVRIRVIDGGKSAAMRQQQNRNQVDDARNRFHPMPHSQRRVA